MKQILSFLSISASTTLSICLDQPHYHLITLSPYWGLCRALVVVPYAYPLGSCIIYYHIPGSECPIKALADAWGRAELEPLLAMIQHVATDLSQISKFQWEISLVRRSLKTIYNLLGQNRKERVAQCISCFLSHARNLGLDRCKPFLIEFLWFLAPQTQLVS